MNNAAAISAVCRGLAQCRRRQANNPTDHSAREIAQMSMLAEYLHDTHNASSLPCPNDQANPKSLPVWDTKEGSLRLQSNTAAWSSDCAR